MIFVLYCITIVVSLFYDLIELPTLLICWGLVILISEVQKR